MPRRFITREDVVSNAVDGVLEIGPRDIITSAAEDIAARKNVKIIRAGATQLAPKNPPRDETPGSGTRVIVSAVGRNRPRVVAEISTKLADLNADILDISQSIVRDYFSLLLFADIERVNVDFKAFKSELENLSKTGDYQLIVQHEDVFKAMHRI